MKIVAVAGFVLAAVTLSLIPVAGTVYDDAFPSDSARRQALDSCARSDPGFNRLLAAARRACYHRSLDAQQGRPGSWPVAPIAANRPVVAG